MHDLPIEIGTPRGLFHVAMNSTPLYSSNICSQTSVSHLCLNNNELMSKAPPLCKGRQPIRCTASRQPQHCTMQVALHTTLHIHVTDAARWRRYTASLKSQGLGVLPHECRSTAPSTSFSLTNSKSEFVPTFPLDWIFVG